MTIVGSIHSKLIFSRRTRVLARHLSQYIVPGSRVLDVGCGDGLIDRMIVEQTRCSIEGIDTIVRPHTQIPVHAFDGVTLPYENQSFEVVMFVDVLHHTRDPKILLQEAVRVGRMVLIKDHLRNGLLANQTLRLMDWVGNAHHGVALPYNYLSKSEWEKAFQEVGLRINRIDTELGLYPMPLTLIFGRGLHLLASCTPSAV